MDHIEFLQKWGRKGGQKTGATKRRGDSEYYRALAKKKWQKQKAVAK